MLQLRVGDIFRCTAIDHGYKAWEGGGYRVWQVVGIHLGALMQESVIELLSLDRSAPRVDGEISKIYVPVRIMEMAKLEHI